MGVKNLTCISPRILIAAKQYKGEPQNGLFDTLIHSYGFKKQRPALGQNSIGKVGQ